MTWSLYRLAHPFYTQAFPLYRGVYSLYKRLGDRKERSLLRELLSPGDTVVDVGANIGIYASFFSALVGSGGAVYAFEPDPRNYSHLERSIRALGNVYATNAAVGEQPGKILLWRDRTLNVDHRIFKVPGENRTAVEVPIVSLDDKFLGTRLTLIKIDVQGSEAAVLRGARQILERRPRPAVLFEFWPAALIQAGENPRQLLEWIHATTSERPKLVREDGLKELASEKVPLDNPKWYVNLLVPGR